MTTIVRFQPTPRSPFSFQATLDGVVYTVIVTWNTFAQRWYVNVYDQNQILIVCTALVSTPDGQAIQSAAWSAGEVTLNLVEPHGVQIGRAVRLSIQGILPDAYNGTHICVATASNQLTYALQADPGTVTVLGTAGTLISLVAGFFTSTLIYRETTSSFEISP